MKARRVFSPAAATVVSSLIALTLFGPISQTEAGDYPSEFANAVFGRRVAGSYLGSEVIFGVPVQGLITVNPGGGFVRVNTDDFGSGVPWDSQSSAHGSWKQTGPRQLTGTDLTFDYIAGAHVSTAKFVRVLEFDEDYSSYIGTGTFEAFCAVPAVCGPVQDPLDPNAVPFVSGTAVFAGRRIPANED